MEIFRCAVDAEREKIFEFMIPVDESQTESYVCDYLAEVPISDFLEEEIMISMEAPSAFMERIENREKVKKEAEDRPVLHFTADAGWINDPNGLIFDDGLYHLYFQYNPFDIRWNNMSWGACGQQGSASLAAAGYSHVSGPGRCDLFRMRPEK